MKTRAVEEAGEDHLLDRGGEVLLGPGLLGQIADGAPLELRRPEDLPGQGREEP